MDAQLTVLSGPFAGHTIRLAKGKFLVGRESDCHCVLDDLSVSRHHCVLILDQWTLRIRDLNSTNGTFINRNRVGPWEIVLADSDFISVGLWSARVALTPAGSPTSVEKEATMTTKFFVSDTTQFDTLATRPAELEQSE